MSDDELNRAVCETVLGWTGQPDTTRRVINPAGPDYIIPAWRWTDATNNVRLTPDFLHDWRAFGLLLKALAKAALRPELRHDGARWSARVDTKPGRFVEELGVAGLAPRALVIASLKAYGVVLTERGVAGKERKL